MPRFAKTLTIILAGAIAMSAVALADPAPAADADKAAETSETPAVTTGSINRRADARRSGWPIAWRSGTRART